MVAPNIEDPGYGEVMGAIANIQIIQTDMGGLVNQILEDDGALNQISHAEGDQFGFGGLWRGYCPNLSASWGF
jgi:hypothetical protein